MSGLFVFWTDHALSSRSQEKNGAYIARNLHEIQKSGSRKLYFRIFSLSFAQTKLLNVSYDPTRELYRDI